jgi:hypothetical protein
MRPEEAYGSEKARLHPRGGVFAEQQRAHAAGAREPRF